MGFGNPQNRPPQYGGKNNSLEKHNRAMGEVIAGGPNDKPKLTVVREGGTVFCHSGASGGGGNQGGCFSGLRVGSGKREFTKKRAE